MRTETVDSLDAIDEMAFPRLAALVEIAWSRPAVEDPDRTWGAFRERVAHRDRCGRGRASGSTVRPRSTGRRMHPNPLPRRRRTPRVRSRDLVSNSGSRLVVLPEPYALLVGVKLHALSHLRCRFPIGIRCFGMGRGEGA